jgi:uncharacterized protein YcbK (DUF882 family)
MKHLLHHHKKSIAAAALHGAVLFVLVFAAVWGVTYGISLASADASAMPTVVTPAAETPMAVPDKQPVPAAWLGLSGSLRAVVDTPDALRSNAALSLLSPGAPISDPGVHPIQLATPTGDSFYVVAMHPYDPQRGAMIGSYHIGSWPAPTGNPMYERPAGVIEVTPDNEDTPVSEHFHLRDFLTHDQRAVWPKALVIRPKLVDKLELISQELDRRGLPNKLHVMSGFRTPQYNALEVGPGGRARLSRHMYGDASDVFVDADGNGQMDDLNGDGKVTIADARVLFQVAESVEATHPELIGGLSAYPATAAHGPFVHVDTRGKRARW